MDGDSAEPTTSGKVGEYLRRTMVNDVLKTSHLATTIRFENDDAQRENAKN